MCVISNQVMLDSWLLRIWIFCCSAAWPGFSSTLRRKSLSTRNRMAWERLETVIRISGRSSYRVWSVGRVRHPARKETNIPQKCWTRCERIFGWAPRLWFFQSSLFLRMRTCRWGGRNGLVAMGALRQVWQPGWKFFRCDVIVIRFLLTIFCGRRCSRCNWGGFFGFSLSPFIPKIPTRHVFSTYLRSLTVRAVGFWTLGWTCKTRGIKIKLTSLHSLRQLSLLLFYTYRGRKALFTFGYPCVDDLRCVQNDASALDRNRFSVVINVIAFRDEVEE